MDTLYMHVKELQTDMPLVWTPARFDPCTHNINHCINDEFLHLVRAAPHENSGGSGDPSIYLFGDIPLDFL